MAIEGGHLADSGPRRATSFFLKRFDRQCIQRASCPPTQANTPAGAPEGPLDTPDGARPGVPDLGPFSHDRGVRPTLSVKTFLEKSTTTAGRI